jgi:TfuA protein
MGKGQALIFLGPSLSHEKARQVLPDAEYLRPARKGDLAGLIAKRRNVDSPLLVGLVDGVFLQDYPPTPIEVYQLAVQPNITLVGSSSLGALRAVELEKFGMVGIGRVFNLFKAGKLDADDEVAVTFTEGDFGLLSEAMIDIRYNLFLAYKKGFIDSKTRSALTRTAKQTYFPHRSYSYIIEETSRHYPDQRPSFEAFGNYISRNRKSLKEKDAYRLLEYVRTVMNQD